MNVFTKKVEYKTHLFFHDNNVFVFLKRPLDFSCLVEKAAGKMVNAWKHFYSSQLYFPGYKNISADTVTLGFSRDVILDPFNKIPIGEFTNEKPRPRDSTSLKKWVARMAENQRHIYRSQRKNTIKEDAVNWGLLAVLGVMTLAWLIRFLIGLY